MEASEFETLLQETVSTITNYTKVDVYAIQPKMQLFHGEDCRGRSFVCLPIQVRDLYKSVINCPVVVYQTRNSSKTLDINVADYNSETHTRIRDNLVGIYADDLTGIRRLLQGKTVKLSDYSGLYDRVLYLSLDLPDGGFPIWLRFRTFLCCFFRRR